MSGGYFDYSCFRLTDFADLLNREIKMNDVEEKDDFGDFLGKRFEPETMESLKKAHKIIELAADLAKEAEWLYSGDTGQEHARKEIDRLLATVFEKSE